MWHSNTSGEHTVDGPRRRRAPGAAASDLADAVSDWWTVGEADVAVLGTDTGSTADDGFAASITRKRVHSFAATALARTARRRSVFVAPTWAQLQRASAAGQAELERLLATCADERSHLRAV